jgi:glycosyltransferase involved in cell wall biosynthesis
VPEVPTIAMLVPAYNAVNFLPNLLQSAAEQTVQFDEIWVYDDCSTDDTAGVAEQLGAYVVRGDQNRGCSHGKNALLARTTCAWVHFHDADDLLLPNFVALARAWMLADDYDAVVFGCEERDAETGEIISISKPCHDNLIKDPIEATIRHKFNSISGIYRRESFIAAGGYDLDPLVLYNEDQAMHCSLARAGLRLGGDPAIAVINLRRSSSMWTSNQEKCLRARYHVLYKALASCRTQSQRYAVAEQLWIVSAVSSSLLEWQTADRAAELAMEIASPSIAPASTAFKALCRVSPRLAIRLRELAIRSVRPETRFHYPRLNWSIIKSSSAHYWL